MVYVLKIYTEDGDIVTEADSYKCNQDDYSMELFDKNGVRIQRIEKVIMYEKTKSIN